MSYPGFEGQKDLGQKQDKAFQADGDELQHKISDSHHPDQVKEVVAVEVGSGKYETGGGKKTVLQSSRCRIQTAAMMQIILGME